MKLEKRKGRQFIPAQEVIDAIDEVCQCLRQKEGENPCGHCPDELVARDLKEKLGL